MTLNEPEAKKLCSQLYLEALSLIVQSRANLARVEQIVEGLNAAVTSGDDKNPDNGSIDEQSPFHSA